MNWLSVLAGPLIGALIGYSTNYIAVKMLFRPLYPVKIGSYTLPFTPGIIPKGKDRLAKTLGVAVGENLLTGEDLESVLLSNGMQQMIAEEILSVLQQDTTLEMLLLEIMEEEQLDEMNERLKTVIADKIVEGIGRLDIGKMIAEEGSRIIQEKFEGTFMAMMINEKLIASIAEPIGEYINYYIAEHGREKAEPIVYDELIKLETGSILAMLYQQGRIGKSDLEDMIKRAYTEIVKKKAPLMIEKLDIAGIVERKVMRMDVRQIEELVLSVMNKELHAIVNLGAVIGFVIGMINIII